MLVLTRFFDRFRFAAADVVGRSRLLQFLRHRIDDLGSCGVRQLAQLVEGIVQVPLGDAFLFQPISSARSRDFCGRVSIIPCASLRQYSERDPFHSFVVSKKRQVQRQKISLPPKPGQLSFGVTASGLLNFRDALRERFFSSEQFANFAQTDHLRSSRTCSPGGAHLLDHAALKDDFHSLIDSFVKLLLGREKRKTPLAGIDPARPRSSAFAKATAAKPTRG